MRFSPKTFAVAILSLGLVVATGWQWRVWEQGAAPIAARELKTPAPSGAGLDRDALREPVAPTMPGSGKSAGVPAGSTGAASPRIALRTPAIAPPADAEWRRSLAPRAALPKGALVSPPGQVHRLTLKLSDRLAARPGPAGELLVTAERPEDVAALSHVADEWSLSFRPVQTATDEALRKLQDRAARRSGRAQPDLGGIVEALLPDATPERVLAAASALHALTEVEFAEIHSLDAPPPPPGDISPPTAPLESNQTYRHAGTGVDVDYVWNTYGIRGAAGLKVTDCEYKYRTTHEDLAGLVTLQPGIQSMLAGFGDDHGTAVLGVLGAGDNGYGMTGSSPWCALHFYPDLSNLTAGGIQDRVATVTAAIADSEAGDIVMLVMQATGANGNNGPAEYEPGVWMAVKAGSDAGVIVVASAGNGAEDLDSAAYQTYRDRGDSGAILVGAGFTGRARRAPSSFGARVNLQGWGESVATTGFGPLAYGNDADQEYTFDFSGTSSATPIVASAVALLQSVAIEILERRLSPEETRTLLIATGRPQTGNLSKPIGPLPDLAAAVPALFAAEPPQLSSLRSWGFHQLATGTPDLHADPDGNGLENLVEYVLGSDPKNETAADRALLPEVSAVPGPSAGRIVRFAFHNPAERTGASWSVESTLALQPATWQPLAHGVGGVTISRTGDAVLVEIVENPPEAQRFLRLRATAP